MDDVTALESILNATVAERNDLHEALAVIKIRPDAGQVSPFKPGQFCTLGMLPPDQSAFRKPDGTPRKKPRLIRRAYSIASSPNERDFLEIFVVLVGEGKLTPNLWTVEEGGRLWLDERMRGEFTLDPIPLGKKLVMVSTGTGLAPFMSMLRTYRHEDRWEKLVLIHGVRRARDLGYREELEQTQREDDRVTYIPICSDEPEGTDWKGLRGRVDMTLNEQLFKELAGFPLNPKDTHLFLCGNPAMITTVQQSFEKRGFVTSTKNELGNIHFERYW